MLCLMKNLRTICTAFLLALVIASGGQPLYADSCGKMLVSSPASMEDASCHDQMEKNASEAAKKNACSCIAMLFGQFLLPSPDAGNLETLPDTVAVFYPYDGEPEEFLFSLQPPPPKDIV